MWIIFADPDTADHKVLTYVEYKAVSGVFQNIDPPPPSPPSESVLPPHQGGGGVHTCRAAGGGGGGCNILEDARQWIGLLQYNLSTPPTKINADSSGSGSTTLIFKKSLHLLLLLEVGFFLGAIGGGPPPGVRAGWGAALCAVEAGEGAQPAVHLLQRVTRDNLGQHHRVRLVRLPARERRKKL